MTTLYMEGVHTSSPRCLHESRSIITPRAAMALKHVVPTALLKQDFPHSRWLAAVYPWLTQPPFRALTTADKQPIRYHSSSALNFRYAYDRSSARIECRRFAVTLEALPSCFRK